MVCNSVNKLKTDPVSDRVPLIIAEYLAPPYPAFKTGWCGSRNLLLDTDDHLFSIADWIIGLDMHAAGAEIFQESISDAVIL